MKRILPLLSLVLAFSLFGCQRSQPIRSLSNAPEKSGPVGPGNQDPNRKFPARNGMVNDFAFVLDQAEKEELDSKLRTFNNNSRVEFAVATISSTKNEPIFDYSLAMAREWALGQGHSDQAGMLMLVSVDDRKWHIQISKVLEKILSNEEVGRLGELMNADFKQQKYGAGINKAVDAFIKIISERRNKT